MTTFVDKYYVERQQTDSIKWDGLKKRFGEKDLLPLWVADMDFKIPEEVQNKMIERINHGVFGYSVVPDSYYQAIKSWQKNQHNVEIEKEWLRFTTGVVNSLHYLIQCFTKEKEAVMICSPVYYPFYDVVKDNKRKLVVSDLVINEGRYEINYEEMEEKIKKENVKALIFCSPHNPVGRVWTLKELKKISDICQKYDVLLISDEIHQDFVAKGHTFISYLGVDGVDFDKLIVVNAASKSFNLASLLHSHIFIPSTDLRVRYDEFIKTIISNPTSLMGVIATQASYDFGEQWLDELNQTIDDNFDLMTQLFNELLPEAIVYEKQGTYLSWVDLSCYITQDKMKEIVQDKAKLAIDYGEWFGKHSGTFIRINLATHPKNIELAIKNLEKAIKNS